MLSYSCVQLHWEYLLENRLSAYWIAISLHQQQNTNIKHIGAVTMVGILLPATCLLLSLSPLSLSLSESLVDGFYCWQKRSTRWARKLNHFRCQLSLPKNSDATAGSKWNRIEMNRVESLKRSLRFSSQEQPMDAAVRSILNCQSINVHWLIDKTAEGRGKGEVACACHRQTKQNSRHTFQCTLWFSWQL